VRIAAIADIHGNLPALEAVLADIQHRDVDRTVNLGGCVSGPLWPREVCNLLMASDDLTIRGNHDRWVSGPDPARMGASSSPATAHRPATISISWRRFRNIGLCEHIRPRSRNGWPTFKLVWFCAGTATCNT
jgi:hypothetical protein